MLEVHRKIYHGADLLPAEHRRQSSLPAGEGNILIESALEHVNMEEAEGEVDRSHGGPASVSEPEEEGPGILPRQQEPPADPPVAPAGPGRISS